eukprot:1183966-Prorocentrum_minimum.AAC.2
MTPSLPPLDPLLRLGESPIQTSLEAQAGHVTREFKQRLDKAILSFNEQGLNAALYWENPDPRSFISVVPTSAITGDGIPDLLALLVRLPQ